MFVRRNFPELLYKRSPRLDEQTGNPEESLGSLLKSFRRPPVAPRIYKAYPWLNRSTTENRYLDVLIANRQLGKTFKGLGILIKEEISQGNGISRPGTGYGRRTNSRRSFSVMSRPPTVTGVRTEFGGALRPISRQNARDRRAASGRNANENQKTKVSIEEKKLVNAEENTQVKAEPVVSPIERVIPQIVVTLDEEYEKLKGNEAFGETTPLWYPETGDTKREPEANSLAPNTEPANLLLPDGGLKRENTSFGVYSNLAVHNRQATETKPDKTDPNIVSSGPKMKNVGLKRENTSFGVYSNLAAHNRQSTGTKPGKTEPNIVSSGPEMKLIGAIKQSDIASVRRILYDNPGMTLNFVDKNGRGVLHHCIDVEENRLDMDIVTFLLKRQPPINQTDKMGQSVLHNAVKLRHTQCVYTLLKHGANVNVQSERSYRTALHEAVICGSRIITCILLYNDADTTLREKNGRLPVELCKNNFPEKDFIQLVSLVNGRSIEIQEIHSDTSTSFKQIGMMMKSRDGQVDQVPALCRKQKNEDSDNSFDFPALYDITSDVYTCQLLTNYDDAPVTIAIRLFEKGISSREDVFVITGKGKTIEDVAIEKSGEYGLMAVFDADISTEVSFVAVCRPKVDQWTIGKLETSLTSSLDERVCMHVEKNTYMDKALVGLQIHEMSEDVEIAEGNILASTPFYTLQSSLKPSKYIKLDIPSPTSFDANGQLMVLLKSNDTWNHVVSVQNNEESHSVRVPVDVFPACLVAVVVQPGVSQTDITPEIEDTLRYATNTEYKICFLCMSKRVEKSSKFSLVVECCLVKCIDLRRRFWVQQGYKPQQTTDKLKHFSVTSKQAFTIKFYDSAINRKDPHVYVLEFHSKRENVLQFDVELQGKTIQFINGRLYIYKNKGGDKSGKQDEESVCLTSLDINLAINQFESGSIKTSLDTPSTTPDRPISHKISTISNRPVSHKTATPPNRPVSQRTSRSSSQSNSEVQLDSLKKVQATLARAMKNIEPVNDDALAPVESSVSESDTTSLQSNNTNNSDNKHDSSVVLDNVLLDTLLDGFDEEWYKIFVLMGVSFSDVEAELLHSTNTCILKKQIFRKWRDDNQSKEDIGLPLLMAALFKGGFRHLATSVQIALRSWFERSKGEDSAFQMWVTKAYQDSNLMVPSDYPKPMSDPFLVLMSDELTPSRDLARGLLLGDTETNQIVDAKALLNDGIRVMKILTLFRDKTSRSIDALEQIVESLSDLGHENLRKYIIMCSKAWVKRTATRKDDPFRYQVDTLMKKYDT